MKCGGSSNNTIHDLLTATAPSPPMTSIFTVAKHQLYISRCIISNPAQHHVSAAAEDIESLTPSMNDSITPENKRINNMKRILLLSSYLKSLAGNVADMLQHVGITWHVAPILARWVREADTTLKMLWQFVSAWADIYQIFQSAYVEIYDGMGVHTHRYYRTHMLSTLISWAKRWRVTNLSCSPR